MGTVGSFGKSSRTRGKNETSRVLPSHSLPPFITKPLDRHTRQLYLSQSLRSSNVLYSKSLAGETVYPSNEFETNEVSLDLSDGGTEVGFIDDEFARRDFDTVSESLACEIEVDKGGRDVELEACEPDHWVRRLVGHVKCNDISSLDTLRNEVVSDTAGTCRGSLG